MACSTTRAVWVLMAATLLAGCKLPDVGSGAAGQPGATTAAPPASPADAKTRLGTQTIAKRAGMGGYSRDEFPHWDDAGGACDVREKVLERDGTDVTVGAGCAPKSGTWVSVYDGETWHRASDVDIDHVVPLGQAWASGAKDWPRDRREQFANDLERPQLKTVTDNLNEEKGDKAPDEWKPPLVSYWCTYAVDWIVVKQFYGLTITEPEKAALSVMLGHCA